MFLWVKTNSAANILVRTSRMCTVKDKKLAHDHAVHCTVYMYIVQYSALVYGSYYYAFYIISTV